ncbi:MAG: hypothetical protein JKX73_02555 [Flavobacteriales bacterium]|nr:hypothetical protein [Flavobacteriales bacterium]
MKNIIGVLLCILITSSCTEFSSDLDSDLLGSWRLVESTTLSGEYEIVEESKEITFLADRYFIMEVYGDYLDGEFGGKFFVLDNQKRNGRTLTLVPNTYVQRADTVSLQCESYDLVSLGDSIMLLQRHTEFIDQGTSKAAVFNRRDRYIRSD